MESKAFCLDCGAEYFNVNNYCLKCGVSVTPITAYTYALSRQKHCSSCGAKTNENNIYCALCGVECNEYTVASGISSQFKGALKGVKLPASVSNAAEKVKTRSVLAPALVFALTAVVAGLILSFIIDMLASEALGKLLADISGRRAVNSDFRIGTVTLWQLTNLGGLSATIRGGYNAWGSFDIGANVAISLGIIWLVIVPVIALLIARAVRKAFIGSKHAGKEIRVIDGMVGAGMYTFINIIISIFPTPLNESAGNLIFAVDNSFFNIRVSVGPQLLNLLVFSFFIAFIFAMPGLGSVIETMKERGKVVGLSLAAAIRVVRLMFLFGLLGAFILITILTIFSGGSADVFLIGAIPAFPNLAIWLIAFFTGGRFTYAVNMQELLGEGSGVVHIGIFGARMTAGYGYTESITWFGLLFLIAGLWITVTAMYKVLRSSENLTTYLAAAGMSAGGIWLLASCATLGLNAVLTNSEGFRGVDSITISSASFANLLVCAIFMTAAAGIVYLTRKSSKFDKIVSSLATPFLSGVMTIMAIIIAVLTLWRLSTSIVMF
jgi:hypothetical protein